jgi:hypothetical protein
VEGLSGRGKDKVHFKGSSRAGTSRLFISNPALGLRKHMYQPHGQVSESMSVGVLIDKSMLECVRDSMCLPRVAVAVCVCVH